MTDFLKEVGTSFNVQEGCANGLYRVCTHSSNTNDENMNVLQLMN